MWGGPLPAATAGDTRPALLSVVMAAIALLAKIVVLPLLSRREPQLLGLLAVFGWVATLLAVLAILMARQAERRIQLTRDKRGMMTAQLGLWLGWATVAYTALSLVTWPIRQVTSNL
jgi:hypothetical protein